MAQRLRPKLVGRAMNMLADEDAAEDVAQDVLLKLWTMRRKLDAYASVEALAMVMARNNCLDRLRRRGTIRNVGLDEVREACSAGPTPEQQMEQRQTVDRAREAMSAMPATVRIIMQMRHVDGMEVAEIASMIGSTPERVRVNLSRGRKRLKEIFDNEN